MRSEVTVSENIWDAGDVSYTLEITGNADEMRRLMNLLIGGAENAAGEQRRSEAWTANPAYKRGLRDKAAKNAAEAESAKNGFLAAASDIRRKLPPEREVPTN